MTEKYKGYAVLSQNKISDGDNWQIDSIFPNSAQQKDGEQKAIKRKTALINMRKYNKDLSAIRIKEVEIIVK